MQRLPQLRRSFLEAVAVGIVAVGAAHLPPLSLADRADRWWHDAWSTPPRTPLANVIVVHGEDPAQLQALAGAAGETGLVVAAHAVPPAATEAAAQARSAGTKGFQLSVRPAFERRTWPELAEDPGALAGRVVVYGSAAPLFATPAGAASGPELLAEALAHYRDEVALAASPVSQGLAAAAALLLLALGWLLPIESRAAVLLSTAAGAAGLAAAGAAVTVLTGGSIPVAGAMILLLASGAAHAARLPPSIRRSPDASLPRARRLVSHGRLDEAWTVYRQLAAEPSLLPELYALGCELQATGSRREAADLFHRVAQIDGRYEDVAKRLVQCDDRPQAAVPDGTHEEMPATLGRYELLEPIGKGAMGNVYLGRDPKINRIVAIKALDLAAEFDVDELPAASERFLLEAATAGRLSHPNIVTIYDVGESGGLAYIAMEYLRGRHLSDFTAPAALLPVPTVLELLARTADALDYAHAQNVVHRDIKPANIMYDSASDNLKITDFGIARLADSNRTRTGIVLGTPAFMSPEQLEGKNVNGHTDLFALGVSLYELLTGHLPFRGASMTKLMFVIANEPHQCVTTVRSDLPSWLDTIVDRALAKNPAERYSNGAAMAAALREGAARLA